MKRYTAAVIGCGNMGIEEKNFGKAVQPGTHAAAYAKNPRTRLVALVDTSKERLARARRYYPNVPLFSDAKTMIEKLKPDIVSIATQPDSHASLTILSALKGVKAIVCEKPIANLLQEGKRMIETCEKSGSLLFINHGRRFDPLIRRVKNDIGKGRIGNILQVTSYSYNGLINNGTHMVDLLRFLIGEITAVQGWTNQTTSKFPQDKNVDARFYFESAKNVKHFESAKNAKHFQNGVYGTLQTLSPNYGFADCIIFGTKGRIALTQLGYQIEYTPLVENKEWKGYFQLSSSLRIHGKLRSFMQSMVAHVVACLDGKETPLSSGQDGLAALQILTALRRSAENKGKRIVLPL